MELGDTERRQRNLAKGRVFIGFGSRSPRFRVLSSKVLVVIGGLEPPTPAL